MSRSSFELALVVALLSAMESEGMEFEFAMRILRTAIRIAEAEEADVE